MSQSVTTFQDHHRYAASHISITDNSVGKAFFRFLRKPSAIRMELGTCHRERREGLVTE